MSRWGRQRLGGLGRRRVAHSAAQGEVPLQRRLPCPSSKRMRRLRLALSILIHRKFGALSDLVNKKQRSTLETKCAASTNTSCGLSWMVLSAVPVAVQVTSTYIHLSVSVSYSWLMVSKCFKHLLWEPIYHDLSRSIMIVLIWLNNIISAFSPDASIQTFSQIFCWLKFPFCLLLSTPVISITVAPPIKIEKQFTTDWVGFYFSITFPLFLWVFLTHLSASLKPSWASGFFIPGQLAAEVRDRDLDPPVDSDQSVLLSLQHFTIFKRTWAVFYRGQRLGFKRH